MVKTQDYIREFVMTVFIRKWIIVAVTVLFTVAAVLVALFWPPVFSANGSILVKRTQPLKSPESIENVRSEVTQITETNLGSENEILSSPTVARNTAERLIADHPHFRNRYSGDDGVRELAGKIRQGVDTQIAKLSYVINVHLKWGDPQRAETILSAYFAEYLKFRSELYNPDEAQQFFSNQLQLFDRALAEREQELIQSADEAFMASPQEQISANLLVIENLRKQLTDLERRHTEEKTNIEHLEASLNSSGVNFFTSVDNMELGDFGTRLWDLIVSRQQILRDFVPASSRVKAMDTVIEEASKSLKGEVKRYVESQRAELRSIEESRARIRERMKEYQNRNRSLYRRTVRNNRIQREIRLLEESYNTFGKRLEEARITAETKTDKLFRVNVLGQPVAAQSPVFPQRRKTIVLGALIGLIAGVTVGFLLEFFDHTFKRPEDVESYASIPCVYSIPEA